MTCRSDSDALPDIASNSSFWWRREDALASLLADLINTTESPMEPSPDKILRDKGYLLLDQMGVPVHGYLLVDLRYR